MTVIAWDGKTLAADKRVSYGTLPRTVTKIYRVKDGLCALSGNGWLGMEMVNWYNDGADPDKFPMQQREDDLWGHFMVIKSDGIYSYERGPIPVKLEDKTFAVGSGRDFAVAAMHLGKTAREAVEIACLFDTGCGNGIDTLELE